MFRKENYIKFASFLIVKLTIKSIMQSKEKLHDVDLTIVKWFYDTCTPMNACNCSYFQHMMGKIVRFGYVYKAPNYLASIVNLLIEVKKSILLLLICIIANGLKVVARL